MPSSRHSSRLRDSPDVLASMTPAPSSETNDVVPLGPSVNAADASSSDSEVPSRHPPRGPSKARAKKARKAQKQALSTSQPHHASLRPAKDTLSRIRHDPSLNDADFIVGYHDRHSDVMELPVTAWRGDITDEEFIPQHRILYFRRAADGVKVWDRKERVDLLFHSGKGDGKGDKKGKSDGKEVTEAPAANPEGDQHDHPPSDDNDTSSDDEEEIAEEMATR